MSKHAVKILMQAQTRATELRLLGRVPSREEFPSFPFAGPRTHELFAFTEPLTQALTAIPEIASWEGKWLVDAGSKTGIHLASVATSMLERAEDGVSPQNIVDDVIDIFNTRTTRVRVVSGVAGISTPRAFELGDGIHIVPAPELPPTVQRETMFDIGRDGKPLFRGLIFNRQAPITALVIDRMMTVISDDPDSVERELLGSISEQQDQAVTCMTLSGSRCAAVLTSTSSWIDHPAFSYSGWGGQGYGYFPGIPPRENGFLEPATAQTLHARLLRFGLRDRQAIISATARLRRARSHWSQEDSAIDLGIAIEMTLLHGMDPERGELGYRTALRGAFLLGKDWQDRRSINNVLRDAYRARSRAVHMGTVSMNALHEKLLLADQYCAAAIRKIIEHGSFLKNEEWDALIMGDLRYE